MTDIWKLPNGHYLRANGTTCGVTPPSPPSMRYGHGRRTAKPTSEADNAKSSSASSTGRARQMGEQSDQLDLFNEGLAS